jgi:predicted DsbA family dithiol-disulfide isomerase
MWSDPIPENQAYCRAGKRRSLNLSRQMQREQRQIEAVQLYAQFQFESGLSLSTHGIQARIAREMGLNRSTVCRYLKELTDIRKARQQTLIVERSRQNRLF